VFSYAVNDNMLSRTRMVGTYYYPAGTAARPHVPVATTVYLGPAAAQGGVVGGGNQVYIERVQQEWIIQ
jgi:hypothetical protein